MKSRLARFAVIVICFALLGAVGFVVVLQNLFDWLRRDHTSFQEALFGGEGLRFIGTCVALGLLASGQILNPQRKPLQITCVFYLVLAFVYALVFVWPEPLGHQGYKIVGMSFLFSMAVAAVLAVVAMPLVYVTVRSARALSGRTA
ncbi:MAG: hypothetical protein ACI8QC_001895 [Planctomycetota bacterium]|jgi:hypothetical protein